jgi:hypothetical protein
MVQQKAHSHLSISNISILFIILNDCFGYFQRSASKHHHLLSLTYLNNQLDIQQLFYFFPLANSSTLSQLLEHATETTSPEKNYFICQE